MIEIAVSDEIRALARSMAKPHEKQYASNKDSIRSGAGHYYAKIGEILVAKQFGWQHADNYNTDCITPDGRKVEVKVKQRNVKPRGNYLASVAAANTRQRCDDYLFCSTIKDHTCYIIGIIPKVEFLVRATFRKEGEYDPDSPPGQDWYFKADCYNLPYDQLKQINP